MTLHSTAELMKKVGIGSSIGLGVIIMLVIFFRIGVFIKNVLNPPRIEPANQAYDKIPPLEFPESVVQGDFTYSIETLTGELPADFPDRLIIYPIIVKQANLLDLQNAKSKMQKLGFIEDTGLLVQEIAKGGSTYEWQEKKGFQRKMVYDIVNLNFSMTSNYLTSNTVLRAESKPNEISALGKAQSFLTDIDSLPTDLDLDKTKNPDPEIKYLTKPQLFKINGNELLPATSLSQTQVIRVDLYQKDVAYTFTAGKDSDLTRFQEFEMNLPVMYPRPPASTMNFLIASGENGNEVVTALYNHQYPNLTPEEEATYPIKSAKEAYDELTAGNGYIAAYNGSDEQILIDKVYLAYYLGEARQEYLMPIIVFEGQNGFFAYISAIRDEALSN